MENPTNIDSDAVEKVKQVTVSADALQSLHDRIAKMESWFGGFTIVGQDISGKDNEWGHTTDT